MKDVLGEEMAAAYRWAKAAVGGGSGRGGGQSVMRGGGRSQHPVDWLIRELLGTRRDASIEEINRIGEQIASVPFDERTLPVPPNLRGTGYLGRSLGSRERADFIHLVRRVVEEGQWASGTTLGEYLGDLREVAKQPGVKLGVYGRRGGPMAALIGDTGAAVPAERLGRNGKPHLVVLYSADRGIIVSGYQFSSISGLAIPEDVLWLK